MATLVSQRARLEELDRLRRYYLGNLFAFTRDILGYRDLIVDTHYDVCEFLNRSRGDGSLRTSNIPGRVLKSCQARSQVLFVRRAVILPRDSFKTTIALGRQIQKWCGNPHRRAAIVCYKNARARDILQEIKDHLEHNEKLRALFGDMGKASRQKSGVWAKDEIQLYDPAQGRLVPYQNMGSALTAGIETDLTGKHPDDVLADDIVCKENSQTREGLESAKLWLRAIQPILKAGSELTLNGTSWDYEDANQKVIDNLEWDVMLRSAVNPNGTLWFKERLTWEYLRSKEREMGTYLFGGQYLNNPVHPEDAIFKEEWIQLCLAGADKVPPREAMEINIWIDPALTAGKRSDFTGILVTGMDRNGMLWVLEAQQRKMRDEEMVNTFVELCRQWRPQSLFMEENANRLFWEPMLQRQAKKLDVHLHYQGVIQSTVRSKEYRIRAIMSPVQTGRIKIQEHQVELLSQMRRYIGKPGGDDHLLDALATAVEKSFPSDWHEAPDPVAQARERADRYWRDLDEPDQTEDLRRDFRNVFASTA